jgi:hypothetical protein
MGDHLVLTPENPTVLPKFGLVSAFRPRDNQVPRRPTNVAAGCVPKTSWEPKRRVPIQQIRKE